MIHRLTKTIPILLLCIMLLAGIPGCGNTVNNSSSGTRIVLDHMGREVTVQANPKRVISLHPICTEIMYCLGAQDKLITIDMYSATLSMAKKINSGLKNVTALKTDIDFNIEELLRMNSDLVIADSYYPDEIQKLADAGLTVIAFDVHGRTTDEEIQLIGTALGKDKEAEKLISYRAEKTKAIAAVIDKIPQSERKNIFYLRYSSTTLLTASVNTFEHSLITQAGGINLGKDITKGKWVEVSWEQLLLWNPEIVMSAPLITAGNFVTEDDLKADPKWSKILAVQHDNVWVMPMGYFKMDCSAPENILGLEYLATKLYPDKFTKFNLKSDIKDFFKTFYRYTLSDEELDSMLQQKGIQMGNS
jgi:iron complex transport system substrate-binding protein